MGTLCVKKKWEERREKCNWTPFELWLSLMVQQRRLSLKRKNNSETFIFATRCKKYLRRKSFFSNNEFFRPPQGHQYKFIVITIDHKYRRYSSGRIILLEIKWREVSYCLLYLFRKNSIFRILKDAYTLKLYLSLIHIWRCRRSTLCRSRWSPYH